MSGRPAVDIVVPVFGAGEALARLLESLRSHTDLGAHRVLLVADGPQPAAVEELLSAVEYAGDPGRRVLRLARRAGFPAAANRGMFATGDRDVTLLNSDTVVTANWLDKLQRAAYSAPEVATATPFANHATICSLPRWLERNALPAGHDADSFAALVERVSDRRYPRLPTGVGVCMYLKRAALAQTGPFDEAAFGLGYGEENDWCVRASTLGWLHVLDDATFVYHHGQASFGAASPVRMRRAHRLLRRRHAEYLRTVAHFIRADPLRPLRERVLSALAPPRAERRRDAPARALHVVHGWPPWSQAGVEIYAAGLARRQARWREVTAYARIADRGRPFGEAVEYLDQGVRVRLIVNNFTQHSPLARNALRAPALERDFRRLLGELRPELVHIHHLAGHCATLSHLARRSGAAVVHQLQDWFAPCARANLFRPERTLCTGPGHRKCSACLPLTRLPPSRVLNPLLYWYRARLMRRALALADVLIAGSEFVVDSHRELGWLPAEAKVRVVPYGVDDLERPTCARARQPGAPLRLGFMGSLLPHKGLHVAAQAVADLDPAQVVLEVWGDPSAHPAYVAEALATAGSAVLCLHGPFPAARKAEILSALDVLLVPSTGLESFGLAAHEALALGVPVIASRRGALARLFTGGEAGAHFDPDRPLELRHWIERLLADPDLLARWRARAAPVKTMDQHAEEIEDIYPEALSLRRGGR